MRKNWREAVHVRDCWGSHLGLGVVLSQRFHHSRESSKSQYKLVVSATGRHIHTDVGTGGQSTDGQEEGKNGS